VHDDQGCKVFSAIARNQPLQMRLDASREHYDGQISDKRA
jgi:hypothetical protein